MNGNTGTSCFYCLWPEPLRPPSQNSPKTLNFNQKWYAKAQVPPLELRRRNWRLRATGWCKEDISLNYTGTYVRSLAASIQRAVVAVWFTAPARGLLSLGDVPPRHLVGIAPRVEFLVGIATRMLNQEVLPFLRDTSETLQNPQKSTVWKSLVMTLTEFGFQHHYWGLNTLGQGPSETERGTAGLQHDRGEAPQVNREGGPAGWCTAGQGEENGNIRA